jgi:hypothetical protein
MTKVALRWTPEGKRKRGRPKTTWRRTIENEIQQSLHVLGVCRVMEVFVGYFVRPEYLHYLSQTGVMEAGEYVDVFINK